MIVWTQISFDKDHENIFEGGMIFVFKYIFIKTMRLFLEEMIVWV